MHRTKPWRGIDKNDIAQTIDTYVIGARAARNREILKTCWLDGATAEACAERFEMSPRQIQQIICDWFPLIDKKLRKFDTYSA